MRRQHKFRLFLLRWHRRVGVAVALLVIILVVTGIPLNHTSTWQLDRIMLRQPWLLSLYGIEADEALGFGLGEQWLVQAGSYLFLDEREVARCDSPLVGAVTTGALVLAACEQQLLVFTQEGELVEKLGSSYGLPTPLSALAGHDVGVWLLSGAQWFALDLNSLTWTPGEPAPAAVLSVASSALPDTLHRVLNKHLIGEPLTLERVLLDVHSGRIFGAATVWLVDAAGLLLLLIALSGCYVWLSKPGRYRRRR